MSQMPKPQFRNVSIDGDPVNNTTVRGWNVENSRQAREAALARKVLTPESPKKIWRKMAAAGTLAVAGFVGLRAATVDNSPKAKTIKVTVSPGDSPWSLESRYNDKSVDVRPLVDQMGQEPQVRDGLQPGEAVDVIVVKPPHKQ